MFAIELEYAARLGEPWKKSKLDISEKGGTLTVDGKKQEIGPLLLVHEALTYLNDPTLFLAIEQNPYIEHPLYFKSKDAKHREADMKKLAYEIP